MSGRVGMSIRRRRTGLRVAALVAGLLGAGCSDGVLTPPADFAAPLPGRSIELAPGQFITLTGAEAVVPLEIPEADDTRAYAVIVQNASPVPGASTPVRVLVRRVESLCGNQAPARSPPAGRSVVPPPGRERPTRALDRWYGQDELDFRAAVVRGLSAAAARPAVARPAARVAAPSVGQTLEFRSPVDAAGEISACEASDRVTGVVRAVGSHYAIVEDTLVAGILRPSDFTELSDEIERFVAPVSEAYSGQPTDLDGNGVVIGLITQAVNRLGAAGFFASTDLSDAEDCATSNEGEILWLVAPDPVGRFGTPVDIQLAVDRLPSIIAHETQHLIHTGRRVFEGGGSIDSSDVPWLNEGLSHLVEEVTGFHAAGLRTGTNLDFADLGDSRTRAVFSRYHVGNLGVVRDYLESTSSVPLLLDVPVTRSDFRRARGFGYLFLRWLADQYATGGAPGLVSSAREEELFRALVLGGPTLARSTENVEEALSTVLGVRRGWSELFGDYAGVPVVDDFALPEVPLAGVLQLGSWNLPAVYDNARENGFEAQFPDGFPLKLPTLRPDALEPSGFVADVELLPSTAYYLRIESPNRTPLTRVSLFDPAGGSVSAGRSIQVTIVRMF